MNQIDTGREAFRGQETGADLGGADEQSFSQEEIEKIREFSKREDVYDLLVDALAPSIWENVDVKKGILCQLFGGESK